jgi:hypothetical protein
LLQDNKGVFVILNLFQDNERRYVILKQVQDDENTAVKTRQLKNAAVKKHHNKKGGLSLGRPICISPKGD